MFEEIFFRGHVQTLFLAFFDRLFRPHGVTIAPFLGAILLSLGAGGKNYTLLYLSAAVLTLLGAVAILPVKKVK